MRAVLVGVDFERHGEHHLDELNLLAASLKIETIAKITGRKQTPNPALYIGSGKAEEIKTIIQNEQAELVIFNHALSPVQQRNLEKLFQVKVCDRTGLILQIFAARAKSHLGKLQVELAQVEYQSSRLVRAWSHLERQKGGIGLRGGPGEAQIELDQRLLQTRAKNLRARLRKLWQQQNLLRQRRVRNKTPSLSLVGYTNAGKSSLFNALAQTDTYVQNQLFATLDTSSRRLYLGEDCCPVLSDTVGFIRGLPHQLVAAFRATLLETVNADLLLHVIDASHADFEQQITAVHQVLTEIHADAIPKILIFNKMDLTSSWDGPRFEPATDSNPHRLFISATDKNSIAFVRKTLHDLLH